MTRVAPAHPKGLFARLVFWTVRRKFGTVPTPVAVAAHHPRVFRGYIEMERALASARTVEHGIKDLVSLRAATLIGCPF